MTTILWHRAEGHARCAMPPDHADFYAVGSDSWQDVLRSMLDAGVDDGPCMIRDEFGTACWQIKSIHAAGRWYRPTAEDKAARDARQKERKALGLFATA